MKSMIFFSSPCQPGREAGGTFSEHWELAQTGFDWCELFVPFCVLFSFSCGCIADTCAFLAHRWRPEDFTMLLWRVLSDTGYAGKMRIIFIYEVELQGCRRTRASQLVPLEWDLGTVLPLSVTLECCFPCKL